MADVKAVIHSDSVKANISTPVLNAKVYRATLPGGNIVDEYNGDYEVTPKLEEQILQTAEKVMQKDVKIKKIPITTITNSNGATTVIIGAE